MKKIWVKILLGIATLVSVCLVIFSLKSYADELPQSYKKIIQTNQVTLKNTSTIVSGINGTSEWSINSSGLLTIGEGNLEYPIKDEYGNSVSPWSAYSEYINRIYIAGPVHASADSSGLFASLYNVSEISNLSSLDTSEVVDMQYMFYGLSSIIDLDLSNFNTSNVTDMQYMFGSASSLVSLDLSAFDTSKVTNMQYMFGGANSIVSLDLNSFDTSKVTNMQYMFGQCTNLKNLNISQFDTSNVLYMQNMFSFCNKLASLDLSNFDTSNVINMSYLLVGDTEITKLSLGSNFSFKEDTETSTNVALPEINTYDPLLEKDTYTGYWQNIGTGTIMNPKGQNIWTSTELMFNYNSNKDSDTYVWQPIIRPQAAEPVIIKYVNEEGNEIHAAKTIYGDIGDSFNAETNDCKIDISGYILDINKFPANSVGNFSHQAQTVTYVYKKSNIPDTKLIPILRAYNPNDGDHLYTSSQKEYDWITGLKWNAEGTAFQSVLSDYEGAIPVYRLYNSHSGEHFYTVSESEYNDVASKGWTKEQVGFYMVPKEKGDAVYRVFNPNATGPGSHLFTSSKEESTWLINQGWKDEGIAFYSAK